MTLSPDDPPGTLIEAVRYEIGLRRLSENTEKAYVRWVQRYVRFHDLQHPCAHGASEVRDFLAWLATEEMVSASTQNQARAAVLFLFHNVLKTRAPWVREIERAKGAERLPVVLSEDEAERVLDELEGGPGVAALLMYGSGLRLQETVRLRIKDIDVDGGTIHVYDGKGKKDRRTMLPERVVEPLREHLGRVVKLFRDDCRQRDFRLVLPDAMSVKSPRAARDWRWCWAFPSKNLLMLDDPPGMTRMHVHPSWIQRLMAVASRASGISKRASCHSLRHAFATHSYESGCDIRTVQELLGHADVNTTMRYVHVLNRGVRGVRSPADRNRRGRGKGLRGGDRREGNRGEGDRREGDRWEDGEE
ncbi:MAG: integron integrase, partial [Gemmatimonas sp.]